MNALTKSARIVLPRYEYCETFCKLSSDRFSLAFEEKMFAGFENGAEADTLCGMAK
jgi:hypothetical protein